MNIKIAIVDSDIEYLERLTGVLQQYTELSVSIFSSAEKLEKSMESRRYEIILFDPDVSSRQLCFPDKTMPVCLGSYDSANLSMYPHVQVIRKYQRISHMYQEIMNSYAKYAEDKGLDFSAGTDTKLIAVYSPTGGCGKTAVSMMLAQKLHRMGKRVLFLSAEQLNSSSVCFPQKEEGIISLLEMLHNKEGFKLKLKGILGESEEGVFYIDGFSRLVDYEAVDKEEIESILSLIKHNSECDFVIVDTSCVLDVVNRTVLEGADRIVLVQKSGELEDKKLQLLEKQAMMAGLRERMCVLRNFAASNTRFYQMDDIPVIGSIHHYGNLQVKDLLRYAGADDDIDVGYLLK